MIRNRIIALLVPENVRQAAQEDFESRFQSMAQSKSTLQAYLWLWGQVICLIPDFIKNSLAQGSAILHSFLKINFRHLRKHRSYSFINIIGFMVSLALM